MQVEQEEADVRLRKKLEYHARQMGIYRAFKHVPLCLFFNCLVCAKLVLLSVCDVKLYSWKGTHVIYPQTTNFIHEETAI